jgi:hypothetical protein
MRPMNSQRLSLEQVPSVEQVPGTPNSSGPKRAPSSRQLAHSDLAEAMRAVHWVKQACALAALQTSPAPEIAGWLIRQRFEQRGSTPVGRFVLRSFAVHTEAQLDTSGSSAGAQ